MHFRNREVARRAAHHIGHDNDTVAAIDIGDGLVDTVAAITNFAVPIQADRRHTLLRADDVFGSGEELTPESSLGNNDDPYHDVAPVNATSRWRRLTA